MKKNKSAEQHITAETMAEKFRKDGWNEDVSFNELTIEDAEKIGCTSMIGRIRKGHKYFRMAVSGNIFDEKGNIVLYNVIPKELDSIQWWRQII